MIIFPFEQNKNHDFNSELFYCRIEKGKNILYCWKKKELSSKPEYFIFFVNSDKRSIIEPSKWIFFQTRTTFNHIIYPKEYSNFIRKALLLLWWHKELPGEVRSRKKGRHVKIDTFRDSNSCWCSTRRNFWQEKT